MKYRKKPVVIEAQQFTETTAIQTAKWCGGVYHRKNNPDSVIGWPFIEWIEIPTLEGVMRAEVGDFIIKGIKGEFYPCKPEIFVESYEVA